MTYSKRHLVLAAVAGLLLGLTLMRLPFLHGPRDKTRRLNRLASRLELTAEQKGKVHAAFERGGERMAKLRRETRDEVRAVLSESQRVKFDEIMARHDKKHYGDAPSGGKTP